MKWVEIEKGKLKSEVKHINNLSFDPIISNLIIKPHDISGRNRDGFPPRILQHLILNPGKIGTRYNLSISKSRFGV